MKTRVAYATAGLLLGACTATNPDWVGAVIRPNGTGGARVEGVDARPGGTGGTGGVFSWDADQAEVEAPDGGTPLPDLAAVVDAELLSDVREGAAMEVAPEPAPEVAPPPDTLPMGLVLYLKFDEGSGRSARDSSSAGNHADLRGGAALTRNEKPTLRRPNVSALRLDGVDGSYVEVNIARSIPRIEGRKSISLWLSPGTPQSRQSSVISLSNPGADYGVQLGTRADTFGFWQFRVDTGEVEATVAPFSTWHHLAYTFDGDEHRLYVDGRFIGSSDDDAQVGTVLAVRLGTYENPYELFQGLIDEVRVYNRPLTEPEITRLAGGD